MNFLKKLPVYLIFVMLVITFAKFFFVLDNVEKMDETNVQNSIHELYVMYAKLRYPIKKTLFDQLFQLKSQNEILEKYPALEDCKIYYLDHKYDLEKYPPIVIVFPDGLVLAKSCSEGLQKLNSLDKVDLSKYVLLPQSD